MVNFTLVRFSFSKTLDSDVFLFFTSIHHKRDIKNVYFLHRMTRNLAKQVQPSMKNV